MIKVFYGEDRVRAEKAIVQYLGDGYETIDGGGLTASDLPNIFWGKTLLAEERSILVKDILANKVLWDDLPTYLDTKYKVIFWEMKLDKRSVIYKSLKDKVEFTEFAIPKDINAGKVFDIYKLAKRDGKKAVEMLREIESTQEPMMFLGLMVSQAVRDYSYNQGVREKAALKELSKLDMCLKSTKLQPWTVIEAFLLKNGALGGPI